MRSSNPIKVPLIAVGAYYLFVGVRPYIRSLFVETREFWSHLSITNTILDLCLIGLGLGLIYTASKRSTFHLLCVIASTILSVVASLASVFVLDSLFNRTHSPFDVVRYTFDLICCVTSLFVSILAWYKYNKA